MSDELLIKDLEVVHVNEDEIDIEDAKKALRDIEKHGSISWETAKRELGL